MAIATATKERVKRKVVPKVATKLSEANFAILETGGKQYRVAEGDSIKIEKLGHNFKKGDSVVFDKILLLNGGVEDDHLHIGTPYISGAKVTGTITEIGRNKKVVVIHYKAKSRYFKKAGHRQPFFKVKIDKITA